MHTLNWDTTLAALNTAIATSSTFIQKIGAKCAQRISLAGAAADTAFGGATLNLGLESSAHTTWRSDRADAMTKLNTLLASIDGGPGGTTVSDPTPADPAHTVTISSTDPRVAAAALNARAAAVLSTNPLLANLIRDAEALSPVEPLFHPAQYYQSYAASPRAVKPTYGEIEDALRTTLDEAVNIIAIA